jgi:hypothetical protein
VPGTHTGKKESTRALLLSGQVDGNLRLRETRTETTQWEGTALAPNRDKERHAPAEKKKEESVLSAQARTCTQGRGRAWGSAPLHTRTHGSQRNRTEKGVLPFPAPHRTTRFARGTHACRCSTPIKTEQRRASSTALKQKRGRGGKNSDKNKPDTGKQQGIR